MVLEVGPLGDEVLTNGISTLKERPQSAPSPHLPHEGTGTTADYKLGSRLSPDTNSSGTLIFGLPSLRNSKQMSAVYKLPSLWCFVIAAQIGQRAEEQMLSVLSMRSHSSEVARLGCLHLPVEVWYRSQGGNVHSWRECGEIGAFRHCLWRGKFGNQYDTTEHKLRT